jgi:hypothetical protein
MKKIRWKLSATGGIFRSIGGRDRDDRIFAHTSNLKANVACVTGQLGFVGAFLFGLFLLRFGGVRLSCAFLGCNGTL